MSANVYFSIFPVNIYSICQGLYFLPLHSATRGRIILKQTLFILSILCTFFLASPVFICLSHYVFTDDVDLKLGNMTEMVTSTDNVMLNQISPVTLTISVIVVSLTCKLTNVCIIRSRIPSLVKKIHEVDIALSVSEKMIKNERRKVLWFTVITAFFGSLDLTSCFYENCRSIPGFELILTFPVCITAVAVLCLELQFFVVCHIIERRFRKLNTVVTKMAKCGKDANVKSLPDAQLILSVDNHNRYFFSQHGKLSRCLESLRFHYQTLSECSTEVNSIYQCYLLISFIFCFMECLLCSYSFALSLTAKFERQFGVMPSVHLIFRSIYCLSRISASSLAGMTVETEASKTKQIVIQLDRRETNEDIKEEIRLFTQYLNINRVNFTVYGLCHLNVRLVSSMLATIVTYLIIMLQLG